jgi:hypothetical protein
MYRIRGGDQKEYGPIAAEQIRQWIAERRLNQSSQACLDGDGVWKALGQFPEFAEALAQAPAAAAGATSAAPAYPAANGSGGSPAEAAARLKAPAIILMVLAAVSIVLNLSAPLTKRMQMDAMIKFGANMMPPEALAELEKSRDAGMTAQDWGTMVLFVGLSAVIFAGARSMLKLRGFGLAMAAAILALTPCGVGCCCVISLPIGVWALITLNKPEVKSQFT